MKGEKYHIYLSTKERNEIVASLINLKNKLIEQDRYTGDVRVDAEPDRFETNICLLRRVKKSGN